MPMRTEDGNSESCREKLSLLLQESQVTQAELKKLSVELKAQHQGSRVLRVLRSALKMSLVSVLGVAMFWWVTGQLDWTGPDWNT
ncbi:hypothetical protein ANANG_G00217990 [Anguilla anguilla]|uniref:Uncharacterized protein n=1 Tax=Anguilla anguilla TaxID=7936 RepID=A0A9D3RPA7_ANGAN|nr:hypothetical protein ANANG_G00217990 [Anguilla anguilla]